MATDRDEQTRQQRELEEIRRSFAEMGARMGSLFEPSEQDANEQPLSPPTPAQPAAAPARPRWWLGALALLFLAGTAFGWILPKGDGSDGSSASPPPTQSTPTTAPPSTAKAAAATPRTVVSVPDACVDTAELADEVISRLDRNVRDQRLFSALRDYTIASQACRKEASS
jgi:hypothetical protein